MAFKPKETIAHNETLRRIEACLNDIILWMNTIFFKLNAYKTEVIGFVPKRRDVEDLTVRVGDSVIKPSTTERNLGAVLDSHLNMEQHVNSVSRSCFMHIRQVGQFRKYLTVDSTRTLIKSLVALRLDYCNSLLYRSPKHILNKLQKVYNTAARISTRTPRYCHITPVLKELHGLPVHVRAEYKLLTCVFKPLHGQAPTYIRNMLDIYIPSRQLRSQNDCLTLIVPRSRTVTYGDRAFMTAAPKLWNILVPKTLKSCETLPVFKRALKLTL